MKIKIHCQNCKQYTNHTFYIANKRLSLNCMGCGLANALIEAESTTEFKCTRCKQNPRQKFNTLCVDCSVDLNEE